MKLKTARPAVLLAGLMVTLGIARADVAFDATGSNNCYPFGCGPMNYQQVYAAAGFESTVDIYGIRFKAAQDGSGSPFSNIPVVVTFDLSTTSVRPDNITGDLASNRGADDKIVFSGTAVISSSGADVFDITFPFASSFTYNPTMGNLLVGMNVASFHDVRFFEAGYTPLLGRATDGIAYYGYGLATSFITTPVPEPEPYTLLLAGLGFMSIVGRYRMTRRKC